MLTFKSSVTNSFFCKIAFVLFILHFTIFCLNTSYFTFNYYSLFYPYKHLFTILILMFTVLSKKIYKRKFFLFLFFGISSIIVYLYHGHIHLAAQCLVFFTTILFYSIYLNISYKTIFVCVFILFIFLLFNLLFQSGNFIYTEFHGRSRLQLGFYHCKEIANFILCCYALWFFTKKRKLNIEFILIFFGLLVLLYYVQSRNALLTFFIFNFVYFFIQYFGTKLLYLSFLFFTFALSVIVYSNYYYFEVFSSGRLHHWVNLIRDNDVIFINHSFTNKVQFTMDNYFLNLYLFTSFYFVIFNFVFLISLIIYSEILKNTIVVLPLLFALVVNCMFDSGLFSTGSMLNIVYWSLISKFFIFEHYKIQFSNQSFRNFKFA